MLEEDPVKLTDKAIEIHGLAKELARDGKHQEAIREWRRCVPIVEKLATDAPLDMRCQKNLATVLQAMAVSLSAVGRGDESMDVLFRAVDVVEKAEEAKRVATRFSFANRAIALHHGAQTIDSRRLLRNLEKAVREKTEIAQIAIDFGDADAPETTLSFDSEKGYKLLLAQSEVYRGALSNTEAQMVQGIKAHSTHHGVRSAPPPIPRTETSVSSTLDIDTRANLYDALAHDGGYLVAFYREKTGGDGVLMRHVPPIGFVHYHFSNISDYNDLRNDAAAHCSAFLDLAYLGPKDLPEETLRSFLSEHQLYGWGTTDDECAICRLPIHEIDRRENRVAKTKSGEVHSYCREMQLGFVPECPLAENLDPKPCSNECIQARACLPENSCGCNCDNLYCQIGQSVRALRAANVVSWEGYVPDVPELPEPSRPLASMTTIGGIFIGNWAPDAYAAWKQKTKNTSGMTDEAARWRAHRQSTLNRRYVVHYLLFLDEHSDTSARDFDAIDNERQNIIAALDQVYQSRRWARVQRFVRVLCPPDGFLAIRGYGSELVRALKQAIELGEQQGDGISVARFKQWLQAFQTHGETHDDEVSKDIESQLRQMREQIVLAQYAVVTSQLTSGEGSLFALARDHDYDQGGLPMNELFVRIDPGDWPESYREVLRRKANLLGHAANVFIMRGNPLRAKQFLEEAQIDFERLGDDEARSNVMMNLSITLRALGNDNRAEMVRSEAGTMDEDDLRTAIRLTHDAVQTEMTGDLAHASRLLRQSYEISARLGYKTGQSTALHVLAKLAEKQEDYAEAERLLEESLEINTELRDQHGVSRTWRLMGDLAGAEGNVPDADRYYCTALDISRQTDDRNETGGLLRSRAALASSTGDLTSAEDLYRQSMSFLENSVSQELCVCLRGLAGVLDDRGDLRQSRIYYERALDVANQMGSDKDLARTLFDLGGVLERLDELATAEKRFSQAVAAFRRISDDASSFYALTKRGDIRWELGKVALAEQDYVAASRQLNKLDSRISNHISQRLQAIKSNKAAEA